jgi:hypothetical protein
VFFFLIRVFTPSIKYLSSLNFALIFCCTVDHTLTLIRSPILLFFNSEVSIMEGWLGMRKERREACLGVLIVGFCSVA